MLKSIILLALVALLAGAEPATKPEAFDGKIFAMSLAGIYHREDALVRDACDDANDEFYRNSATQAAICNEWNGPFRLRDFALWLQATHLDKRLRRDNANWDSGTGFKHLPGGMHCLSFILVGARPLPAVVFVLDETVTAGEVDSVLRNPSKTAAGEGPIIYGIKPTDVPMTIVAPGSE